MTRSLGFVAFWLVLPMATAVTAAPAVAVGLTQAEPDPLFASSAPAEPAREALFFRLPELYEQSLPATARVEYRLDGQLEVVESFELGKVEPRPGQALELLAYHPELLVALAEKAADPARVVEVSVFLDETLAAVLPFEALARAHRELRESELHPLAVRPAVKERGGPAPAQPLAVKGFVPDPACAAQCNSSFEACLPWYPECVANPYSFFCPCTLEHADCMSACPLVCVDPKSVTPFTRYEEVFSWYGATDCRWINAPSSWGYYFTLRWTEIKKTTGTRTEYCNGSYSEQVQSVSYQTVYCLDPFYPSYSCYPTVGGAATICFN